ncbi:putative peptidase [Candidatus Termititenax persephonae]|uniref:Peptidase n=1 Tax=Candidatus Termititenax persephonae TaxID=2218525 RepID=A0A388THA3_9BACT|nr:putative peptidase [Candidatus Termititenax persephonae]
MICLLPAAYAPNKVLVKLKTPGTGLAAQSASDWQSILSSYGVPSIAPTFPDSGGSAIRALSSSGDPRQSWHTVEYPSAVAVENLVAELQKNPAVEHAEPVYIAELEELTPNDPYFREQYYLPQIHAPEGWSLWTGSSSVKIAVIDTGVQTNHPDLHGKILPGWDCLNNNSNANPDPTAASRYHGTLVAGLSAAAGNNGEGIAGLDWQAKIIPLKVFGNHANSGQLDIIAQAIYKAVDLGANIINMSLSSSGYSLAEREAVVYAYNHGIILVAAMGNIGGDKTLNSVRYPAAFPEVISVGSVDRNNHISSFSVRGSGDKTAELVAPGENIYSTYINGAYINGGNGTSYSTPLVAGLAALLKGKNPDLTNLQIRELMRLTADDLGETGHDSIYGHGLINVHHSLYGSKNLAPPEPPPVPGKPDPDEPEEPEPEPPPVPGEPDPDEPEEPEPEPPPVPGEPDPDEPEEPEPFDRLTPNNPKLAAPPIAKAAPVQNKSRGEKIYAYPNPLHPLTKGEEANIVFFVEKSGWVRLIIYDMGGRKVWQTTAYANPGENPDLRWDGQDERGHAVPNGGYILILADEQRKIIAKGRLLILD